MTELSKCAETAKSWPFDLARKLLKKIKKSGLKGDHVVFETGYGPSGFPHIGTFGEVARTCMVQHAFQVLTNDTIPTKLVCFSDDLDGMRKIPQNIPSSFDLNAFIDKPLSVVPDPFGTHESFAAHNNNRLCQFLDSFGFKYEFLSATDQYTSGAFDTVLLRALDRYDAIMQVMLPTLGL